MRIPLIKVVERLEVCPKCGEATKLLMECGGKRYENPCACRCVRQRIGSQDQARQAAREADAERRRMVKAFGERVPSGDFAYDDGRNYEAMDLCLRYATKFAETSKRQKNGLILIGETRVGKTFAAEAIAMHLHRSGLSVLMDTAAGFVQRVQDREPGLMEKVSRCDLLIVDDLGASRDTSFGHEAILTVIDTRISARRPMVITANVLPENDDVDTKRLYGRVTERCYKVAFDAAARQMQL